MVKAQEDSFVYLVVWSKQNGEPNADVFTNKQEAEEMIKKLKDIEKFKPVKLNPTLFVRLLQ